MKYLTILLVLFSFSAIAQKKKITEEFFVNGACGMCEKRVETAAYSVKGVLKADWNLETKKLKVTYKDDKTSKADIEKAIAKVGHDTENEKAPNDVYDKLHHCCKYRN